MGEGKRGEIAVRQAAVQALGLQTAGGLDQSALGGG
jgi:hypothetical protein